MNLTPLFTMHFRQKRGTWVWVKPLGHPCAWPFARSSLEVEDFRSAIDPDGASIPSTHIY